MINLSNNSVENAEQLDFHEWLQARSSFYRLNLDLTEINNALQTIVACNDHESKEKAFIQFYWSDLFNEIRNAFWARRTLWSRLYRQIHCPQKDSKLYGAITLVIRAWDEKRLDGLDTLEKKKTLLAIANQQGIQPYTPDFYAFLLASSAPSFSRIDCKDISSNDVRRDRDTIRRGAFHDAKNYLSSGAGLVRHVIAQLKDHARSRTRSEVVVQKIQRLQVIVENYKTIAVNIEHLLLKYLSGEIPPNSAINELKKNQKGIEDLRRIVLNLRELVNEREDNQDFLSIKQALQSDLKFVISNANRAIDLIQMITSLWLGWSMLNVNLYSFIDDMLLSRKKRLKKEKNIQLRWYIDQMIPNRQIFIYDRILQMALMELILNAEKYSQASSVIVHIGKCGKTQIEVSVKDNGVGMTEETMSKLFKPYNTVAFTKYIGTGLGLSSIKNAIEGVGGEIEARSTVGKGTQFIFRLPMNDHLAFIPDSSFVGSPIILAITGLAGNHRKVIARQLAGELGLRYINIGFLLRVLTYYLIHEKPEIIAALKTKLPNAEDRQKIKKEIIHYFFDFIGSNRINYETEPITIDGVDSALTDEEGFSLRRTINATIDGNAQNTALFHVLTNLCEVKQAVNFFLGKLLLTVKDSRRYHGIVAIAAEPVQIADDNIVLMSSIKTRGERKRTDPEIITYLDTTTGGVKRIVHQVFFADLIIDTTELLAKDLVKRIMDYLHRRQQTENPKKKVILQIVANNSIIEEALSGCVGLAGNPKINLLGYDLYAIKCLLNVSDRIANLRELYFSLTSLLENNPWSNSLWARLYAGTVELEDTFIVQGLCRLIDALDENRIAGHSQAVAWQLEQITDEITRRLNLSPDKQAILLQHLFYAYHPPEAPEKNR
jgi:signal transduction histidine kinase